MSLLDQTEYLDTLKRFLLVEFLCCWKWWRCGKLTILKYCCFFSTIPCENFFFVETGVENDKLELLMLFINLKEDLGTGKDISCIRPWRNFFIGESDDSMENNEKLENMMFLVYEKRNIWTHWLNLCLVESDDDGYKFL